MKKLFWLLLLAVCYSASAATITINGVACAEPCAVTISYGGSAPAPAPVPAPAPIPVPSDTCSSQGLQNAVVSLDWGSGFLKMFGMSAGQSYSFSFTPSDYGRITTVYGGAQKVISISTKKCDFAAELANTRCLTTGTDPAISYSTSASRYYCPLTASQTYYVNIRNAVLSGSGLPVYPIQDSCSGQCQFSITY